MNRLSVYHAALSTQHIAHLQSLISTNRLIVREQEHAADFIGTFETIPTAFAEFCQQQHIDYALLPEHTQLADFGLIVSDMDSTFITIECIDELADIAHIKPQIAAITERAMQGELDFAQSLTQRVALLEGLDASALETVYQHRLKLMRGAERLLQTCEQHQIKFVLVSGGFTYFTDRLRERFNLHFAASNQLEIHNGTLTGRIIGSILDSQAKADWLEHHRQHLNLQPHQTLAIGDGANDLKMIAAAGLGIAYHAKPIVSAQADMAIRYHGLEAVPALLGT